MKTRTGADVESDHDSLVGIKLKQAQQNHIEKQEMELLKGEAVKNEIEEHIEEALTGHAKADTMTGQILVMMKHATLKIIDDDTTIQLDEQIEKAIRDAKENGQRKTAEN